jgi:L-seryl-tRNA(Ser) seleniumtransferase
MLRQNLLDSLPGMPKLIHKPVVWEALQLLPQLYGNEMVRRELEKLRQRILDADDKELTKIDIDPDKLAEQIATVLREKAQPSVHPAVNAAGIILHTALGRAPLCKEAQEALKFASQGYCTMAIDRETGRRGDRYKHVEDLLCFITGAEAGCVVNNNAAATMVLLNTIAQGKEVIVSRGQLVEIGGSFRIPDVMRRSGAIMSMPSAITPL